MKRSGTDTHAEVRALHWRSPAVAEKGTARRRDGAPRRSVESRMSSPHSGAGALDGGTHADLIRLQRRWTLPVRRTECRRVVEGKTPIDR